MKSVCWAFRLCVVGLAAASAAGLASPGRCAAQPAAKKPAPAARPDSAKEDAGPREPEEVQLTTRDGVVLHVTYYEGIRGQNSIPVVLLHAHKGSRQEYEGLASKLQELGNAPILVDLRGHGQSTKQVDPGSGQERTLDAARFRVADFAAMVQSDLVAVKKFVREKNNEKKLNLKKLCVVGAEMGASVAVNYAAYDWSLPDDGSYQRGRDVRAVVLLAPEWNFKGVTIKDAVTALAPVEKLSLLVIAGDRSPKQNDAADRIDQIVKRVRQETDAERSYYQVKKNSSLGGTKMLGEPSLNVGVNIAKFIQLRLEKDKSLVWEERRHPREAR